MASYSGVVKKPPQNEFETQVVQIAALGVWQIVTGKSMARRLETVSDSRWEKPAGAFVTLRSRGRIRGSMGMLESSSALQETLFETGQMAATHDSRFQPLQEIEISDVEIEVTLITGIRKMESPSQITVGTTGLIVSRGEKRGVLLPHIAAEQGWSAEQFLEACCEKAQLSHKAWSDPNTLVEIFDSQTIDGGNLVKAIKSFI